MSATTVEIECLVVHETPSAWAVVNPREDDEDANWVWLPKSQTELMEPYRGNRERQMIDIEMPEWLAVEKELV